MQKNADDNSRTFETIHLQCRRVWFGFDKDAKEIGSNVAFDVAIWRIGHDVNWPKLCFTCVCGSTEPRSSLIVKSCGTYI